jgi:nicotinamidase-related amidase
MNAEMTLPLRARSLRKDEAGYSVWETISQSRSIRPNEAALVLCDVWDKHWCRAASARLEALLPRLNHVAGELRKAGILIVHAPSDTVTFYDGTPARQRALDVPRVQLPDLPHDDPALPIYDHDGGCDSPPDEPRNVWSRQHAAIEIDQERDVISDDGVALYSLYQERGIKTVLIMGVHANMCMLERPFAIKPMVRWGLDVVLVRDLTDAAYNPASPPYVSHDDGTRLVVEYIEKFWCPSVMSEDLLTAAQGVRSRQ